VGSRLTTLRCPQLPGVRWLQAATAALVTTVVLLGPRSPALAAPPLPAPILSQQLTPDQPLPSTPAPAAPAAPAEPQWRTHLVVPGDDLWTIAENAYGDGFRWHSIAEANPCITDPHHIEPGWSLILPGLTEPISAPPAQIQIGAGIAAPADDQMATAPLASPPRSATSPTVLAATTAADPIAGLSALGASTAGLVLTALGGSYRRRNAVRPLGRRYQEPAPAARRLRASLHATQEPYSTNDLHYVLRSLGTSLRGSAVPELRLARVRADAIEFQFCCDPGPAPTGFSAQGTSWTIGRASLSLLTPPASDALSPWPALACIGTTDGCGIFSDLDQLGALSLPADHVDIAAALLSSLAANDHGVLALAASTSLVPLAQALGLDIQPVAEILSGNQWQPMNGDRVLRLDPDTAEEHAPRLVFLDKPPTLAEYEQLRRCGAAVIGPLLPAHTPSLTPNSLILGNDVLDCTVAVLTSDERRALIELCDNASATTTTPAWWWDGDVDGLTYLTPRLSSPLLPGRVLKESVVTDPPQVFHPQVRLLGPIDLIGAHGQPPPRAEKQCIEYAAWLLDHPGGTASQMTTALFVAESTRRSNMSRLRAWLGNDEGEGPYLPDAYSGKITLAPTVTSDWQRFCWILKPGVNRVSPDILVDALEMVRGCPLADAAPTQWFWAEELRSDMVAAIRDAAAQLARIALAAGDVDLVRWATARGLVAAPEDECLVLLRAQGEQRVGNFAEVERLVLRLTKHAALLGVDLADDTVTAVQLLLEHRPRARSLELSGQLSR
ncbi:MAG: LysM peptidoglycan-binding domain-containing protein, partial [Propionibacteriaceae bacterium]